MDNKKNSDKETITLLTSAGTIVLDFMEVQCFVRKGNTTEFTKGDNSIIIALLPFEHYEEQVKGCRYMFKPNDDAVVNFHFIESVTDGDGNEIHKTKKKDKPN